MTRLGHLAAVLFLLAVTVFALRVVVWHPATLLPFPTRVERDMPVPGWGNVVRSDQKLTVAIIAHNARAWLGDPAALMDGGICYPAPNAITLGEHMFGLGLLGTVPAALSGDPIFTYNVVVALTIWLAAVAMYVFVYFWTGSVWAALVAAVLFGFHQARLVDIEHPYIAANAWTPLALLAGHHLFTRGRWRDALALIVCAGLQTLESIYAVMAFAIIGATFFSFLLWLNRRRADRFVWKLVVVAVVVGAIAAAVFGPYLATRATWGTLGGRSPYLFAWTDFLPGARSFPGALGVALALVALADRLVRRRAERGYDPRLVFALAGFFVAWAATDGIGLPFSTRVIPSLFDLGARVLPGFDAIRGAGMIRSGVYLVVAVLGGYGAFVLLEHRRAATRALIGAVLVAAALSEAFYPPAATLSFGDTAELRPYFARPPGELLRLYDQLADGAVLDVPFKVEGEDFFKMANYVFLGAFHRHPVTACYNSFTLPILADIEALAARLGSDARAGQALAALGIRNVVVDQRAAAQRGLNLGVSLATLSTLTNRGSAARRTLFTIADEAEVGASLALLASDPPVTVLTATGGTPSALDLGFRNGGPAVYRHPDPLLPTRLLARWYDPAGTLVETHEVAALLPLALAPAEEAHRILQVPTPRQPASYRLTIAPAAAPDVVVARADVTVQ